MSVTLVVLGTITHVVTDKGAELNVYFSHVQAIPVSFSSNVESKGGIGTFSKIWEL